MPRRRRDSVKERPSRRPPASQASRDDFESKFSTRQGEEVKVRSWRQQQKLRKKLAKKSREKEEDKRREEAGEGRITRRKRFTDPELTFAPKSMVFRLKYGDLKDKAARLDIKEPVQAPSFRSRRREEMLGFNEHVGSTQDAVQSRDDTPAGDHARPREYARPRDDAQPREYSRPRDDARRKDDTRSRDYARPRDDTRPRDYARSRDDARPRDYARPQERTFTRSRDEKFAKPREYSSRGVEGRQERSFETRGPKKEMMNMTVKYTTAASQFLYGRSVVKAALEQGRRKLYNLYIYGGDNRKDLKDNTVMTRLAEKNGVPITIVPNGEQRIMDKMSMGRPHNGFVLETSPLPQLPVKSLGRLEETPARLGFHVELDFQTKEEQTINGTDTFVRRANDLTPRPFVLLLNEILDPGNLGGILRTASYLGVDAVGITTRGSSTLTHVFLNSAAGAVEEISLFTVDDPVRFVEESSKSGWKTYAAVAPPDRKLVKKHGDKFVSTEEIEVQSPLNDHPCLLVLGNEGYGLSKPMKVAADYELSVPRFVQKSCVDSLNVSVAAGLLCHAFVKDTQVADKKTAKTTKLTREDEVDAKLEELEEVKQEESEEIKEKKEEDSVF